MILSFGWELLIYGGLVVAYFFLVLHFLGNWLLDLFQHHRTIYAFMALALVVAQGLLLEAATRGLLKLFGGKESGSK